MAKGAIENANKLIRQYIPKGTTSRTCRMRSFAKFSIKSTEGHEKNSMLTLLKMFSSDKSLFLHLTVESRFATILFYFLHIKPDY